MTARFHIEFHANRYVKGWPTTNPKPYRVYENGKFVKAFASRADAVAFVSARAA